MGFRTNAATFLVRPRETLDSDSGHAMRRGRGLRSRHNFQPVVKGSTLPQGGDEVLADIRGQKEHIITKLRKTFDANIQSPFRVAVDAQQTSAHPSPDIRRTTQEKVLGNLQKKYQLTPTAHGQSRKSFKHAMPRDASAHGDPSPGSRSPAQRHRASNIGKGTQHL